LAFAHYKQRSLAPIVPKREDCLFKEVVEGVILFNENNTIQHCNDKALKFLSKSFPNSIPAMTLRELIHQDKKL